MPALAARATASCTDLGPRHALAADPRPDADRALVTTPDPSPLDSLRSPLDGLRSPLDSLRAGTAVVTATHRGTPVGVLLTTLAPVGPGTDIVSFGLSGYSYAWPALEKATHIGLHLIDPTIAAEARLAECFSRTSVDGFLPEVAWHLGPDDVALLDDAPRRAIAVPTQRVHVGSHVVVVARLLDAACRRAA